MKKILGILVMLVSLLILVGCEDHIFWGDSKIDPPQWIQGTYYNGSYQKFEFTSDNVIETSYSRRISFKGKADNYTRLYSSSEIVNGKNFFQVKEENKYISDYIYTFTDLGDGRIGIYMYHGDTRYDKGIYTKVD